MHTQSSGGLGAAGQVHGLFNNKTPTQAQVGGWESILGRNIALFVLL